MKSLPRLLAALLDLWARAEGTLAARWRIFQPEREQLVVALTC